MHRSEIHLGRPLHQAWETSAESPDIGLKCAISLDQRLIVHDFLTVCGKKNVLCELKEFLSSKWQLIPSPLILCHLDAIELSQKWEVEEGKYSRNQSRLPLSLLEYRVSGFHALLSTSDIDMSDSNVDFKTRSAEIHIIEKQCVFIKRQIEADHWLRKKPNHDVHRSLSSAQLRIELA
jgi:hypothetical protein